MPRRRRIPIVKSATMGRFGDFPRPLLPIEIRRSSDMPCKSCHPQRVFAHPRPPAHFLFHSPTNGVVVLEPAHPITRATGPPITPVPTVPQASDRVETGAHFGIAHQPALGTLAQMRSPSPIGSMCLCVLHQGCRSFRRICGLDPRPHQRQHRRCGLHVSNVNCLQQRLAS